MSSEQELWRACASNQVLPMLCVCVCESVSCRSGPMTGVSGWSRLWTHPMQTTCMQDVSTCRMWQHKDTHTHTTHTHTHMQHKVREGGLCVSGRERTGTSYPVLTRLCVCVCVCVCVYVQSSSQKTALPWCRTTHLTCIQQRALSTHTVSKQHIQNRQQQSLELTAAAPPA